MSAPALVVCPACDEPAEFLHASPYTGARVCESCLDDEDQDAARTDPTTYGAGMLWDGDE